MDADACFLAAAALHLGFQATVTVVVYPALGDPPTGGAVGRERRHTGRMAPLVAFVYGSLLASAVAVLVADGIGGLGPLLGVALVVATTGLGAVPQHTRLGRSWDGPAYRRLVLVDRVRSVLAVGLVVLAIVRTTVNA